MHLDYRQATETDLVGEYAVFHAAQQELHTRRGVPWMIRPLDPDGMWAQVQRHLLAHDGERAYVAEADGHIVGFTAALVRGDFWFFSTLFIDPAYQGQGVGRHLLDLAWSEDVRFRATITEAIQPVSTALYARRGLLPVTPMLSVVGQPHLNDRALRAEAATPTAAALRAIDLAAYGFDRAVDHALWQRACASATVWMLDGEACAYSYRGGFAERIGPIAGRDPTSAALALHAELGRSTPGETVRFDVPGTATKMVAVALEAQLQLADPGLLLLSPPDRTPTSYTIHSYWLM